MWQCYHSHGTLSAGANNINALSWLLNSCMVSQREIFHRKSSWSGDKWEQLNALKPWNNFTIHLCLGTWGGRWWLWLPRPIILSCVLFFCAPFFSMLSQNRNFNLKISFRITKHYKINRNYKKEIHQKFMKKMIKLHGRQYIRPK